MASVERAQHVAYVDVLNARLPAEFFRPVRSRALWFPLYTLVIAACITLIVSDGIGLLTSLALSLATAVSFTCLGILAHETLHGSVVESRWLRRAIATACLAPLCIGPAFWAKWHNTHHAHTQHPLRDPDTWGTVDSAPHDRTMGFLRRFIHRRSLLFLLLLCMGVTAHLLALMLAALPHMRLKQRVVMLTEFLTPLAFWLSLGFWLGWRHWIFFYLVPLLAANFIINLFVVTNHFLNPLDESGDPLASSLTVTTYPWLERLFLNFNYHAEHHLLPGISPKYAPQVAQILKELWPDRYHQMRHGQALRAVWRTPRVYFDHISLIDLSDQTLYDTLGHGLNAEDRNHSTRNAAMGST